MKKFLVLFLAFVLVAGVFLFLKGKPVGKNSTSKEGQVVLFGGATCPHCQKVEEWLKSNSAIREKSRLETREVYSDQDNQKQMVEKATECKLDQSRGIGVPFLYDHGKCIIGDQPIIDYLSEKYK